MKLIFLLFLAFAPLHIFCYHVLGELIKYSSRRFYPHTEKYLDNAYYMKLSNFEKDDILYFKVTIRYGYFTNGYLPCEGSNSLYDSVSLRATQYYHSREYSSVMSGLFYNSYTYNYKINKPFYTYLYVAAPDYRYQSGLSNIEIYSTNSFGISIWVWIGVGAFVLVVIILSIVIYRCRRAQREKAIDTGSAQPIISPSPVDSNAFVQNQSPYVPNASPYPLQTQPQVYY